MATFYRSFTELLKLKFKKANWLILFGVLGSLLLNLFNYINGGTLIDDRPGGLSFVHNWVLLYSICAFFLFLAFYCLQYFTHFHVNRSQTWRLIPLSSMRLYWDNLLTSFVATVGFAIYELLVLAVLTLLGMLTDKVLRYNINEIFQSIFNGSYVINFKVILPNTLGVLLVLILTGFFFYLLVDFICFSSQTLANFIPGNNVKIYKNIIFLLLLILMSWLTASANLYVKDIFLYPSMYLYGEVSRTFINLSKAAIIMIIFDMIFLLLDLFLYKKYYEATPK